MGGATDEPWVSDNANGVVKFIYSIGKALETPVVWFRGQ